MNVNMLRDDDNDAGFWSAVALSNASGTWAGASLHVSTDGGANYTKLVDFTAEATIGYATNALGNFQGGNIPDELNSLNVKLYDGSFSSTTNTGLLSGVNAIIVGEEIIYFRSATLETDGTYTLGGFLRGRRGSEYAMSKHAVNDRVMLVNMATFRRVPQVNSEIGKTRLYKAVPAGSAITAVPAKSFTNAGSGLKTYACVHLGGGVEANTDWTLKWVRRSRISGEWRDSVDVPIGETTESYEVEIWNSSFTTLKRTITGLTASTVTYTASQQTADWGGAQTDVYFVVYQISGTVGRGYPAYGHAASTGAAAPAAPPSAPTPAPAPPPAAAPAPYTGGPITVGIVQNQFLQMGNYWVEDNIWNPGNLVRGTYDAASQYEQYLGVSPTLGVNGEIAWRMVWKWPVGTTEVKSYPAAIFGRKPGFYSSWINPGGLDVVLPNGTISQTAPSGATPNTFLPKQLPLSSLSSSFSYSHNAGATGQGHLSYDIWLQSTSEQASQFVKSSITHEIMIPLNSWGGYGTYPTGRNPGWYDHDVTLGGILYHVYCNKSGDGGLRYDFGWLDGTHGRNGWKFIVFQPDTAIAPGTINLAQIINYVSTRSDVFGSPWATGNEYCVSVDLGVEPIYGTGDLVVSNYRVLQ